MSEEVPKTYVIRLVAAQSPSQPFVSAYKPGAWGEPTTLEVTADPRRALQFPTAIAAWECWRQEHGLRPDGKPNRPLTAYTVMVMSLKEALTHVDALVP